jgi:hypothetical protein
MRARQHAARRSVPPRGDDGRRSRPGSASRSRTRSIWPWSPSASWTPTAAWARVEQGIQLLRSWLERHASLDLLDALFQWELQKEGPAGSLRAGARRAAAQPDAARSRQAARGAVLTAPAEQRTDIELIKQLGPRAHPPRRPLSLRPAASRRASSTGVVRPAAAGRPIRRAHRRVRPDALAGLATFPVWACTCPPVLKTLSGFSRELAYENHRGRYRVTWVWCPGPVLPRWATTCCAWTWIPRRSGS